MKVQHSATKFHSLCIHVEKFNVLYSGSVGRAFCCAAVAGASRGRLAGPPLARAHAAEPLALALRGLTGPQKVGFFSTSAIWPILRRWNVRKRAVCRCALRGSGDENLRTFSTAPLSAAAWSVCTVLNKFCDATEELRWEPSERTDFGLTEPVPSGHIQYSIFQIFAKSRFFSKFVRL